MYISSIVFILNWSPQRSLHMILMTATVSVTAMHQPIFVSSAISSSVYFSASLNNKSISVWNNDTCSSLVPYKHKGLSRACVMTIILCDVLNKKQNKQSHSQSCTAYIGFTVYRHDGWYNIVNFASNGKIQECKFCCRWRHVRVQFLTAVKAALRTQCPSVGCHCSLRPLCLLR